MPVKKDCCLPFPASRTDQLDRAAALGRFNRRKTAHDFYALVPFDIRFRLAAQFVEPREIPAVEEIPGDHQEVGVPGLLGNELVDQGIVLERNVKVIGRNDLDTSARRLGILGFGFAAPTSSSRSA